MNKTGRAALRLDIDAIAAEVFSTLDTGAQVAPFSSRVEGFDLAAAYRVAAEVHAMRIVRGERPVGRKIGFTNRTIWPEYDVWAPIWGYMYDRTVADLLGGKGEIDLAGLAEPRIEPEIVFVLARPPEPGMDVAQLLGCIDAVAHGFEIVQSIFPGWRFRAADTAAALGLHGALRIGPWQRVAGREAHWLQALESFEIDLACDGEVDAAFAPPAVPAKGSERLPSGPAAVDAPFALRAVPPRGPSAAAPCSPAQARTARGGVASRKAEHLRRGPAVPIDHGRAVNVLDGPLHALRHLVEVLAADPAQPLLATGEIVTTGTLTRAIPVAAGQTWSTTLHGIELPGLELHIR